MTGALIIDLLSIFRISTHTLTWSVTQTCRKQGTESGNFNSHAHVERDEIAPVTKRQVQISTHTLTWSVTSSGVALYSLSKISTHTLTWSVTICLTMKSKMI